MEEALVGQQIGIVLVVERRGSHWVVGDASAVACTGKTLVGELHGVVAVQGVVGGHQASVRGLLEPVAECSAVRGTDCVGTSHTRRKVM